MGLDANREKELSACHAVSKKLPMLSGSVSEHRIQVLMPPNVMEWLGIEARAYGLTTASWIRYKLMVQFENRPQDWRDKLKG